ncbi:hypothetical protein H4696_008038 [Amycolatopsis lexingtonensis]|uniref:Transposase n=1 Tax=Amycolatopsis lexingtonensis TaxID=218822 RepID=A0ABR9ICM6_9PSEU|nr:hypothetical protein [Amycolatopsis lexingtonensis]MBE1500938.1 hypothetical protein [Amycolatopsis lexingtonensis]
MLQAYFGGDILTAEQANGIRPAADEVSRFAFLEVTTAKQSLQPSAAWRVKYRSCQLSGINAAGLTEVAKRSVNVRKSDFDSALGSVAFAVRCVIRDGLAEKVTLMLVSATSTVKHIIKAVQERSPA